MLRDNAADLLRFTRRFSLCADDAQDAYQRGMEILLRRMREEPPENPLSWLRTVLRHEAGAVREQRLRDVGREVLDLDRHQGRELDDPADRAERFEELARAGEALRRLKPQEVTALMLRAEGLSYAEICARTGWTYTRCNRAITEGRRAFVARMKAIESGAECERWLPLLSLLADGEASSRDLADLRPHLRSCRSCRAMLRDFHDAPRQIGELLPAALLPVSVASVSGGGHGFGLVRHLEGLVQALSERAAIGAMRMQGAIDALPGSKVAAVAASTAAIAGGGAAIDQVATRTGGTATPGPAAAVAAGDPQAARSLVATTGAGGSPIVALPPVGPSRSGTSGGSTRSSSQPGSVGEFGFESSGAGGSEEHARGPRAASTVGLARAASREDEARRQRERTPPAEFPRQPASTPPTAAVSGGDAGTAAPTPPPAPTAAPAPSPSPSESAPPEFAGP